MTTPQEHKSNGIGKDLVVYVCLLALAGLQFLIAYQNIDITQKFIFGRKGGALCCLSSFLRFPSCSGCNMGGPTVPGCWSAPRFQNDP